MKTRFHFLLLIFFLANTLLCAQSKEITLEDLWVKGAYFPQPSPEIKWTEDGFYAVLGQDTASNLQIVKYKPGKKVRTVISTLSIAELPDPGLEDFSFSPDNQWILFSANTEQIYRRSSKSDFYLYNISKKEFVKLSVNGKISYPSFSPDNKRLAFVRENNLYYYDLASRQETPITKDGAPNKIINGSTDWVYEEEFEFTQAYFWSPDSKSISWMRFDETKVPEYSMQLWNSLHPQNYVYKYPKAGEKNSDVSVHNFNFSTGTKSTFNAGSDSNFYVPRIKWTGNSDIIAVYKLNRKQNHLQIYHWNVSSNTKSIAYEEKNNNYIEINDDLTYLKDGKRFVISSEKNGFRHLYLYDYSGKQLKQITTGNWEVDKFLGVNDKENLFYTSTEGSHLERHLYSININGKGKEKLTRAAGNHEIEMSPNYEYFIDHFSSIDEPTKVQIINVSTKAIEEELVNNKMLSSKLADLNLKTPENFTFTSDDGTVLYGNFIKPKDFDPNKKYPVLVYVYGGPGSQMVKNAWGGVNYIWFQMLAQKDIIVATIDNRGTGGRGANFKKMTQNNLGGLEAQDLIATAKFLATFNYVEKSKIGIFGWSFGGYMASLAMTLGADYYHVGIAVAPVTSWRFYDTIYTERFLGTPQENPNGYDENSPLTHAKKLKGAYLLVHGTADDNVLLQNTIEMERALIKNNKQFTSFHYPDKNHSIAGGNTRYNLYTMMTDFLLKNLTTTKN